LREQGNWFKEVTILIDWAQISRKQKQYHSMINKLWAALGLISQHNAFKHQHRKLAEIYGLLGFGYLRLGNSDWGVKYFTTALQYIHPMPDQTRQPILKIIKAKLFLKKIKQLFPSEYQKLSTNPLIKELKLTF